MTSAYNSTVQWYSEEYTGVIFDLTQRDQNRIGLLQYVKVCCVKLMTQIYFDVI